MSLRLGSSSNPTKSRENRPSKTMKKKVFFVFEGAETEKIYFEKIKNIIENSTEPQIPELYIFDRILKNRSHQLYVTKNIEEFLKTGLFFKEKNGLDSLKVLLDKFEEEDDFSYDDLINQLKDTFKEFPKIVESISKSNKIVEISDQIDALNSISTYKKDFDNVCIIIDRDKHSFIEEQLAKVVKICKENNFLLGLTNPCFEFYLLLHLSDCSGYTVKDLVENEKTGSKTLAEAILNSEYKKINKNISYKKNSYDTDLFLSRLEKLYHNCSEFPIDLDDLDSKSGSLIPGMLDNLGIKDVIIEHYK